ncbi:MAG: Asp-tRNA(Asn)/Glu-tRNA(Gln) amidotransferase subunit GatC [Lactovum sp.]
MSKITRQDVEHVAQLSKLKFEENEIEAFRETLSKTITMFEKLAEVDTNDVPFTMNVTENINCMREDIAEAGWDREELMKNVPTKVEGFIQVPAMLESGGDA